MKVFVFCVAILLATVVSSSPIESDETVVEQSENELESTTLFSDDEVPVADDNNEVADTAVIDEEEVAVPFEEKSLDPESFQDNEEEVLLSPEDMERVIGIDVPLCAQYPDLRNPLHLSHLTDCTKFYKCYLGRAFLMDCPDKEHWSVALNRCDYPPIAKCRPNGNHQYKIKKTKPLMASEQQDDDEQKPEVGDFEIDPRCENSDPFKPLQLKHNSDCSKFYKCYMGKAYVIKCPKGQHWAPHLNRCEHAAVARCTLVRPAFKPAQAVEDYEPEEEEDEYDEVTEHTIIDDPDYMVRDPRCIPDETDIYHPIQFAHPTDCTMFYKCFDHKAHKSQCPPGLHYNARDEQCDYPFNARCNYADFEAAAGIIQADMSFPSIPDCPKGKKVNIPVEGLLNAFFSCDDGLAYLMECERGEAFNPKSLKCEKFSMPQGGYQGMYQYPGSMNQYPGAWGQMPQYPQYPQYPQDQYPYPQYPQDQQQYPQYQPQQPPKQPQQPPKQPQQPYQPPTAPLRPVQPPTGPLRPVQPNPDFPSWMPIPNPNVPMPDFPSPPKTPTDGSKVDFNYQDGKPNSRCPTADEPLKPTHLSHETECRKFYKCFNGRAFLMDCPGSQEWSDTLQRCDYHQFANCDPIELVKKKIQN